MSKNHKYNFFEDLKTSDNLKNNILDKTINLEHFDYKYDKKFKLSYACLIIFMITISSSIVLAMQYIQQVNFKEIVNENGSEQVIVIDTPININGVKNFECKKGDTLENISDILGIKFNDNIKYDAAIDICTTNINAEGNLESVSITIGDYIDYSESNNKIEGYDSDFENNIRGWVKGKHISLDIAFITHDATDETLEEFSNLWAVSSDWGDGMEVTEVSLEEMGVIAYYYSPIRPGVNSKFNYVVFMHNNIGYLFQGYNVSSEEIIKMIQ